MAQLTYNPEVFRVPDEAEARRIILTETGEMDTEERWARETPYLAELLGDRLRPGSDTLLVDYGCGIGRLAKALIGRHGCRVLGVDISEDMRRLAPAYVGSDLFSVVSLQVFRRMVENGLKVDGGLSVWVLQHCLAPGRDLDILHAAIRPGGLFAVVNTLTRAVPTKEKLWAADGVDIRRLLGERFTARTEGALDPAAVGQRVTDHTFWGVYER